MSVKKNIQKVSFIALVSIVSACGVRVSTEPAPYDEDDYVEMEVSYFDDYGYQVVAASECVNLDRGTESGTFYIDNDVFYHTVTIDWIKRHGDFDLKIYDDGYHLHSSSRYADGFRIGQSETLEFSVDGADYEVRLSGPGC